MAYMMINMKETYCKLCFAIVCMHCETYRKYMRIRVNYDFTKLTAICGVGTSSSTLETKAHAAVRVRYMHERRAS